MATISSDNTSWRYVMDENSNNSGGKLDAMTVAMGNLISSGIQAAIDGKWGEPV